MHTLAIDIGGTKVTAAVFDGEQLIERNSSATDRAGGPAWMLDRIVALTKDWVGRYRICDCGVGFGGPVDFPSQQVVCSTHVEGWLNFDLVGALAERLGVQAVLDRDTMVGALGEGLYGAGKGLRPLFYLTLSTGIGGGLLTEDGLYRGSDSFACEIGHHTVEPDGPECLCGARGCLERLCAGIWLERDFGQSGRELFADPAFAKRYVRPLAIGLKNCIMFLNPARIVIGGGISQAGDALFIPLREELSRQITAWSRAKIDLVPASLGEDSVLWGALALALTHLPAGVRR